MKWNPEELQKAQGKSFELRFLPYLGADESIGYTPEWCRRGSGHGRWEEYFHTEQEARERLAFLISVKAIEDARIGREVPGQGFVTALVHEWRVEESEVEA